MALQGPLDGAPVGSYDQLLDAWDEAWSTGRPSVPPLGPPAGPSGRSSSSTGVPAVRGGGGGGAGPSEPRGGVVIQGGRGAGPPAAPHVGTPTSSALSVPGASRAGTSAAGGSAHGAGGASSSYKAHPGSIGRTGEEDAETLLRKAERIISTTPPYRGAGSLLSGQVPGDGTGSTAAGGALMPDITVRKGGRSGLGGGGADGFSGSSGASHEVRGGSMLQASLLQDGDDGHGMHMSAGLLLQQMRAGNVAAAAAGAALPGVGHAPPAGVGPAAGAGVVAQASDAALVAPNIVTPKPPGSTPLTDAAHADGDDDDDDGEGEGDDEDGRAEAARAAATAKRANEVEQMLRSGLPLTPIARGSLLAAGKGAKGSLLTAEVDDTDTDDADESMNGHRSRNSALHALRQAKAAQQQQQLQRGAAGGSGVAGNAPQLWPQQQQGAVNGGGAAASGQQQQGDPVMAARAALAGAGAAWDKTRAGLGDASAAMAQNASRLQVRVSTACSPWLSCGH